MRRIQQPYSSLLLRSVKALFLKENHDLLHSILGYTKCLEADCIQDLLDHSFAMAGYSSKEEYYLHSNPIRVARNTDKPLLMINAVDGA